MFIADIPSLVVVLGSDNTPSLSRLWEPEEHDFRADKIALSSRLPRLLVRNNLQHVVGIERFENLTENRKLNELARWLLL